VKRAVPGVSREIRLPPRALRARVDESMRWGKASPALAPRPSPRLRGGVCGGRPLVRAARAVGRDLEGAVKPAVAVMAKAPAGPVRVTPARGLTPSAPRRSTGALLDRLDAVAGMNGRRTRVHAAEGRRSGRWRRGFRLVPRQGRPRRAPRHAVAGLLAGSPGRDGVDSDSPTLPLGYVARAAGARGEPPASCWGHARTAGTTSSGSVLPSPRSSRTCRGARSGYWR
jgi:hypothetical protein